MAQFTSILRWAGRSGPMPPINSAFGSEALVATGAYRVASDQHFEPQPISAFACIIDYAGETRLIVCRRFDLIGTLGYVGAICHLAGSYRQFRCDRITSVYDSATGERLGDGLYFDRFEVSSERERAPTFGLSPSRRATIIAGLNVLAFMARCDGQWHPLESEAIERFVCSMWLRKEWDGEPDLTEITVQAGRLSPDSATFFSALGHYARSRISTLILRRAIADLIAADGVICAAEHAWGADVEAFFAEYQEDDFTKHFGTSCSVKFTLTDELDRSAPT